MKKEWSVYIHRNIYDGKRYIGITSQLPEHRWRNGSGYKYNPYFWNAISKYGWDSFSHEVIFSGLEEECAKAKEVELISLYNTTDERFGYNLTAGGDGTLGRIMSDDTKKKISASHIGLHHSEATRQKLAVISSGNQYAKGYKHSEEAKSSISKSLIGNQFAKGLRHTYETRLKMSNSHKGTTLSGETRKKISSANKGRVVSDETRRKISNANKGKATRSIVVDMFSSDGVFVKSFDSAKDAMRELGVDNSQIIKVCKKKAKTAGGYIWRYHNDKN